MSINKDTLRALRHGFTVKQEFHDGWVEAASSQGIKSGEAVARHRTSSRIMKELVEVIDGIIGPE